MSSLFATIRAAVRPGALPHGLDDLGVEADANASNLETPPSEANPTGGSMSDTQTVAGAAQAAAATIAAAAAASGGSDGFKTAMDRINAALGADSIKGDAKRMGAALDLANASPDMSAEAIVAFVTANVPAATASAEPPKPAQQGAASAAATYEQQRVAAANLAMPGGGTSAAASGPKINRDAIFAARRNTQKGV
ncbi:hypothetical protein G6N76_10990 [Rhizobium daejeonense]|uniref:Uncharacterized protein n=1 Tax=Rhizobium daejeonense TaxID=240521 RepID=A0A6M1RZQ3_9HYPH|nr:hypothetical protein [Rhizobium daejeonense]NGO64203.1 hypothetical protein [Rhizobium daejeonense]